jgi:hypothetical protein
VGYLFSVFKWGNKMRKTIVLFGFMLFSINYHVVFADTTEPPTPPTEMSPKASGGGSRDLFGPASPSTPCSFLTVSSISPGNRVSMNPGGTFQRGLIVSVDLTNANGTPLINPRLWMTDGNYQKNVPFTDDNGDGFGNAGRIYVAPPNTGPALSTDFSWYVTADNLSPMDATVLSSPQPNWSYPYVISVTCK